MPLRLSVMTNPLRRLFGFMSGKRRPSAAEAPAAVFQEGPLPRPPLPPRSSASATATPSPVSMAEEIGLREPAVPREPGVGTEPAVPHEPQLTP